MIHAAWAMTIHDRNRLICAEYLMGVTVRHIAAAYHVCPASVVLITRAAGLPSRKAARAITPDEHTAIREARLSMRGHEAAARFGRHVNTVYAIWEGYR